jgi:hypothetical protein
VLTRPVSLAVAALVTAAEGLVALVLGGYVAVQTVVGEPSDLVTSIVVAAFGLMVGAGLLWVAWGLFTAQRWGRSPAVLAQILAIPVSITLIQSDRLLWGIPLIAAAIITAGALLAPSTTQALYGEDAHREG